MNRLSAKVISAAARVKAFFSSHEGTALFSVCLFASLLRYCFCGFEYFPTLDDYIQYHNYPLSQNYSALIMSEGLFASRPLAIIVDLFVFGRLWGKMFWGVALCAALYAASATLFYKTFKKLFGAGMFFAFFYLLFPLGFEGSYWISASSRVIPGLFFVAAAVYFLTEYHDRHRAIYIIGYVLFQLSAFFLYEQIFILGFAASALILILYSLRDKRFFALPLASVPCAIVYFIFTNIFASEGLLASRMELCSPLTSYFWRTQLPYALGQVSESFFDAGFYITARGFLRGIKLIFSESNYLYLFLTLLASAACFFVVLAFRKKETADNAQAPHKFEAISCAVFAALLALAPVSLFLFLGNTWFSLRHTVASFVGLALLADLLLRIILKSRQRAYASLTAVTAFIFIIISASEVYDYKQCYIYDSAVTEAITELDRSEAESGRVGIIGMDGDSLSGNYCYHEHALSLASADWALYGAAVATGGRELSFLPVPLDSTGEYFYRGWNYDAKHPDGFTAFYFWDKATLSLVKLSLEKEGVEKWILRFEGGEPCAVITERDGCGFIEFN